MATLSREARDPLQFHDDNRKQQYQVVEYDDENTEELEMEESQDAAKKDDEVVSDDDPDGIDEAVLDDMQRFEQSFKNINQRYRLINRIGEGTFSTVYKAEDLLYDHYQNDWDMKADKDNHPECQAHSKPMSNRSNQTKYVAIKKIYVTSSPLRILNELELLHDLRNSPNVCPLITAFRHQDQVIAILPYFSHQDFRDYYREFSIQDTQHYLFSLFTALKSVHECEIIHRDIKPTNFLYSPAQRHGVLVDFGLAEREGTDYHLCACCLEPRERHRKFHSSVYATTMSAALASSSAPPRPAYPNNDQRSSRRANRAGTRGFRAPEVLLKCTAQTSLVDVWSCGIILLTFLAKRFPFFNSADDIDAFIELCCIFGKKRMKEVSLLHGQVMQTNIPTISDGGHSWEKIILWCTGRNRKAEVLSKEEQNALEFMRHCLELDPAKRITAEEALQHSFLTNLPS